ncbi:MAG: SDR family NAD(P)-dependent oxidoreductase [Immundisolibacterales bacterium]|nr:SDR family NAD(P)-dependent oxidoreductase [Immundisolibacterales bacterium]
MTKKLEGKVAIVTGGSDGIGAETCRRFAREGARVAIMARTEPKGLEVQEEIRREGGDATFIRCDVTDSAAVKAAVDETVSTYEGINVLMNNAGRGFGGIFPDEEDDDFDATIRVNLFGTFYMSRAVWPHLVEAGGGVIINVSSVAAVIAHNKRSFDAGGAIGPPSAYAAAKGGVEAFTRYTAAKGGHHNIRINCIRPGQILVPYMGGTHPIKPYFEMRQLLNGSGYPEDAANLALFLASDDGRFITAETIDLDGGYGAKV